MIAKATLIGFTVGTALVVTAVSSQAIARGGAHAEDPWAAAHIEGLPAEVRQVARRQISRSRGRMPFRVKVCAYAYLERIPVRVALDVDGHF
jgi:hypothetical protein